MAGILADLDDRLRELVARHRVAGVGLAVVLDGKVQEFAAGVADVRSAAPFTTGHVCLVGSTTKVYTATLLMQLVAEGAADLDAPVRRYLPEFRVADADTTERLTLRDLLRHTSGLGIGAYAQGSRNDSAVADFVASLHQQPVVHAPGERFGYSNAGYVVAGRVVEVLTGLPWDVALDERLLRPAGLGATLTRAEDVIVREVALPHVAEGGIDPEVAAAWGIAGWALGPTGSTLAASAGDLARFGLLHLTGGRSEGGEQVLDPGIVADMQSAQVSVPWGLPYADEWCLGWYAAQWGAQRMVGHTGHNRGAGSHLALFPDAGGALALVFNTVPGDAGLHNELFTALAHDLFGASKPDPWRVPAPEAGDELARYAGQFTTDGYAIDVEVDGDMLLVRNLGGVPETRFRSIGDGRFGTGELGHHHAAPPEGAITPQLVFEGADEGGRAQYVYSSVFVMRRAS